MTFTRMVSNGTTLLVIIPNHLSVRTQTSCWNLSGLHTLKWMSLNHLMPSVWRASSKFNKNCKNFIITKTKVLLPLAQNVFDINVTSFSVFHTEVNSDYLGDFQRLQGSLEVQKRRRFPYLTTKRRTDLGTLVVPFTPSVSLHQLL